MSNLNLKNITNNFQDVRLISLASWKAAAEITPRDRNGPYVVMQEGYDPEDMKMLADEFVLGRSGRWLSLGFFFQMPVPERRAEFVFGTAAEVMRTLQALPSKSVVWRPGTGAPATGPAEGDEMAAALAAGRSGGAGPAS